MVFDKDYAKYYDLFNKGKDYTKEVDFLGRVFEKFGKRPVSILDLGCGIGMHDQLLAERGYEVIGLDLSKEMIEIAKKNINKVNFLVSNISDFNLSKKFDIIICMFSVLGYLTKNKQLEGFFRCCRNHLNEDGLLILDIWNGLGVMNELPISREKVVEVEGLKIVRRSFPNLDSKNHINNVRFNVRVFQDNELIKDYDEMHKVRFFFPLELKKYMEDAGFELIHMCPSYDIDKEVSHEDWNMIVVGRLKKEDVFEG